MKICIICFDFKGTNIRLQPWRYIYELAINLNSDNIFVEVITDVQPLSQDVDDLCGISISHLPLRPLSSLENKKLIKSIYEKNTDIILWLLGPTSVYLIPTIKKLNVPIIALWIGTTYNMKQIMAVGSREIVRNFSSIYLHVINVLVPKFFVANLLNIANIDKVVVLSEINKRFLIEWGVVSSKIQVVPAGISCQDLCLPDDHEIKDLRAHHGFSQDDFIILYIGSPLTLRGVDTLINGFHLAKKHESSLKLLILSRRWINALTNEEKYIKKLCSSSSDIFIVSGFLNINDVKIYIASSDLVVLPFKLVQSDIPIAILEAMALGKPVISTNVGCISEILQERGIVLSPNNPKELADAIVRLYADKELLIRLGKSSRKYMEAYLKWEDISGIFAKMFLQIRSGNNNYEK